MQCRRLRGAANIVTIVVAMCAVAALALGPATAALLPLTSTRSLRQTWRAWTSASVAAWLGLVAALIEGLLGVRFVITGAPLRDDAHLVIMNHRTRLDWALLWPVARRAGVLGAVRIALKASLRIVPFGGYAMQLARFLFLHRKYEVDAPYLASMLRVVGGEPGESYGLLIFPEGTDLHPGGVDKSDAYAAQHGLARRIYSMHPRARGFVLAVNALRGAAHPLQRIYDATIAFSGGEIAQGEDALWTGIMPRVVHVHIESHDVAALPDDDARLTAWLADRFAEKERALALFYEQGYSLLEAFALLRSRSGGGDDAPAAAAADAPRSEAAEAEVAQRAAERALAVAPVGYATWARLYAAPVIACTAAVAACAALIGYTPVGFGIYIAVYLVVNVVATAAGGWQRFEIAMAGGAASTAGTALAAHGRRSGGGAESGSESPATPFADGSPLAA